MAESLELKKGKNPKEKKVVKDDFKCIAEHIIDLQRTREKSEARKDLDRKIKEVDRQVAMCPDKSIKMNANGSPDKTKAWMSELELPNQRQALEVLNADARRFLWPDSGSWFEANVELTDEYLRKVENLALIAGDENETRSSVNQEIANEIAEAWLLNQHRSYNFRANMDIINSEAFKYGVGIGRARRVKTSFFSTQIEIPQLVPVSLKNTYLDDSKYNLLHEGINLEPGEVRRLFMKWEDLVVSASKGGKDPDDMMGGWIPSNMEGIQPEKDKEVELIEFEGDLVVSKSSESIYAPGVIVTVCVSDGGHNVIRYRDRKSSRSSYFKFKYHEEDIESPYAVGPLVMGHPVQAAACHALNRAMDAATFSTVPHLFWDADDPEFQANGGPVLMPGGSTGATGDIKEIAPGDPAALFNVYLGLQQQYSSLTGMTGSRLGAETKSHTTAYSKDQEISRGQVRTVDYVKSVMQGPLQEWLQYCYEDSKDAIGDKEVSIFLHKSKSFMRLSKDALPDNVFFDIFGASGPAEDAAKVGAQIQALNTAIGLETAKRQLGEGENLDLTAVQKEFLRKGGLIDVDKFYEAGTAGGADGVAGEPVVDGAGGGSVENAVPAAIQALLTGGQ